MLHLFRSLVEFWYVHFSFVVDGLYLKFALSRGVCYVSRFIRSAVPLCMCSSAFLVVRDCRWGIHEFWIVIEPTRFEGFSPRKAKSLFLIKRKEDGRLRERKEHLLLLRIERWRSLLGVVCEYSWCFPVLQLFSFGLNICLCMRSSFAVLGTSSDASVLLE